MCGITAYYGSENCVPIILEGLKRLEYRGYDSAGIALLKDNLIIEKVSGKVDLLCKKIKDKNYSANIGIAHTRWATHGEPNQINAHPHHNKEKDIALVHNGIIENFSSLKTYLEKKAHNFITQTDTEVLTHLISDSYTDNILDAVKIALSKVQGTYGIAVISSRDPDTLVVARKGSPLLIGKDDKNNYYVASDMSAIIKNTNKMIFLQEDEIAIINKNGLKIHDLKTNNNKEIKYEQIDLELEDIEKSGYKYFMLKEINEQNKTILNTIRGRFDYDNSEIILGGFSEYIEVLKNTKKIILTACGTSWHSSLIGKYIIEKLTRISVEVEYASEFRYRDPIIEPGTVVFAVSQSGETADTLAAMKEAKRKNAKVFGIVNVVGSTIARESDAGVYIHAGPEIGVASTKAFTSQVMSIILIALYLGKQRNLKDKEIKNIINEINKLPKKIKEILDCADEIKKVSKYFSNIGNALFLGRDINFPVALEGALKLKEISYIHAEGYPAAEMKHGPIALVDENMPCVVLATNDNLYKKVLSNMQEIKARKGKIIAIATKGNKEIKEIANQVIYIPKTLPILSPILNVIPLQLLSYYVAVERGLNVDKPRNLAKSVTVE